MADWEDDVDDRTLLNAPPSRSPIGANNAFGFQKTIGFKTMDSDSDEDISLKSKAVHQPKAHSAFDQRISAAALSTHTRQLHHAQLQVDQLLFHDKEGCMVL